MPANLPDAIGRYEVLSRLGRGGMGVVYRGRDPRIGGRYVAIKLLHVGETGLVDRFLQEAATAGVLDHPNIVRVYDFGEHFGDPFIVMEFVEGVTLAELIRTRSPLSLARKLGIIRDIALGLDHAHNVGVIHRDVKPANLMIRKDGIVKILDFGIARVANTGMTQVGALVGTPNYMSPEQIDANPVDRRSDVFALGLVFYELLALRPAFRGETSAQVMRQILLQSPDRIESVCADLDPAIARIVHTAIEKDPGRRYQSLAALADDIDEVRRRLPDAGREFSGSRPDLPPLEPAPDTITAVLRQARQDLAAGKFASAVRATSEILVKDPANDEARSLSREALAALDELRAREEREKDARRIIAMQEEAFRQGRIKEALAALDQFTPRHTLVTAAATRLRAEAEEIELQRRVDEQRRVAQARWAATELETARESVTDGRFDEAIAVLEHVKRVCPDLADVDDVLAQARAGLAAAAAEAQRRRDLRDAIARATRDERANRLEDARTSFQMALALDSSEPEAARGLARVEAAIQQALEEQRRRDEAERHIETTVAAAFAQSDAGAHGAAIALLDALSGTDRRVAEARAIVATRLRTVDEPTQIRAAHVQAPPAPENDRTVVRHERDVEQFDATLRSPAERVDATLRRPVERVEPIPPRHPERVDPIPPRPPVRVVPTRPEKVSEQTSPVWTQKTKLAAAAAVVVLLAAAGYVWKVSSSEVAGPVQVSAPVEPPSTLPPTATPVASVPSDPKASPSPAVNAAADPKRRQIETIQGLIDHRELVPAAVQVTEALRDDKQNTQLAGLSRTIRNAARARAEDAKKRAESAGHTAADPFKRGVDRLNAIASRKDGPESLTRTVQDYLDAESLFNDAANAPAKPVPLIVPAPPPAITPIPTSAGVLSGTSVVTPSAPPPSPLPATPTPVTVRPPTFGEDDAQAFLTDWKKRFLTLDVNEVKKIYPKLTARDEEFFKGAKKDFETCTLVFSALQPHPSESGDTAHLEVNSVFTCKWKRGTSPPESKKLSNVFELQKVGDKWQVLNWQNSIR